MKSLAQTLSFSFLNFFSVIVDTPSKKLLKGEKIARLSEDVFGQQIKTIASDSSETSKEYDSQGNVKVTIDAAGRRTEFVYDAEKRVVKTIMNDSTFTEVIYDNMGRRSATINAKGDSTKYEYDLVGNNTKVIDALGNETRYIYDNLNRRSSMIDALGRSVSYTFDSYDRMVQTTYADGSSTTTEYDLAGRKVAQVDAESKRTEYTYDGAGQLKTVTDAMSNIQQYTYTIEGQKHHQIDAKGHVTNFVYDSLGRMTDRFYPEMDTVRDREQMIYNADGQLDKKIVGVDTTTYEYDSLGRAKRHTYSNSGHSVETFYGVGGIVDSVVDYRGTTIFEYDSRGRQSKVLNPDSTFFAYDYDVNGNKISTITPWDTTTFIYDKLNRMTRTIKGTDITKYFYSAVGARDSVSFGTGTATGYIYDDLNRLTKVTNYSANDSVISSFEYTLNSAGIRTSVTELDGSVVSYVYDDLYRLVDETRTGTNPYFIGYTYDEVGNRLTKVEGGDTTSYSYNERDQLLSSADTTWLYDASGRMTRKAVATSDTTADSTYYSWKDNDRLFMMSDADTMVSYTYDFRGVKVGENGTEYLVDHSQQYAQVIAEYRDTLVASYTYGLERISQTRGSVTSYYLADGQGSIRQLTDVNGVVTDTYGYKAFGEELYSTGTTVNEFKYVGESFDANSGFYYLRARWMNPSTGRFVSVDPFAGDPMSPVSLHRYLYANGSPITWSDPSGEVSLVSLGMAIHAGMFLAAMALPILSVDFYVEKIEGYFAERPLVFILDPGKIGGVLDNRNLDLTHEHVFFDKDDKTQNAGFVEPTNAFTGVAYVRPDTEQNLRLYRVTKNGFDKKTLKKAVENLSGNWSGRDDDFRNWNGRPYNVFNIGRGRNCQSFAEAVRDEYHTLRNVK